MTEYKKKRTSAVEVGTCSPPSSEVFKNPHPLLTNHVALDRIFGTFGGSALLDLRKVCSTWAENISGRLNQSLVLKLKNRGKIGSRNHVDVIRSFLPYQNTKTDFRFVPATVVLHVDRRRYILPLLRGEWAKTVRDLTISGVNRNDWRDLIQIFVLSFANLTKFKIILTKLEIEPLQQGRRNRLLRNKTAADFLGIHHGLETFELVHDISQEFEFPFSFEAKLFPRLTNYNLTCHKTRALLVHLANLWSSVPQGKLKNLNLSVQNIPETDLFTAEEELQTAIVAVLNHHGTEKLTLESRFPFQMVRSTLENLTAPINHLTLYVSMRRVDSNLGFFEDVLPALCQGSIGKTLRILDLRIRVDGDWRRQVDEDDRWTVSRNRGRAVNLNIKDLRISKASGTQSRRVGMDRLTRVKVPDVFQEFYSRLPTLFPNVEVLSVFLPTLKAWRTLMGACGQLISLKTLNVYSTMRKTSMNSFVLFGLPPGPYSTHSVGFEENYRGLCGLTGIENINVYAAKGLDTRSTRMAAFQRLTFKSPISLSDERLGVPAANNVRVRIAKTESKFKGIEAGADEFFEDFCKLRV